jgi:hypothetical protein
MKVIATIAEPSTVRKLLRAMDHSTGIPPRAPPREPPQGEFYFVKSWLQSKNGWFLRLSSRCGPPSVRFSVIPRQVQGRAALQASG